MNRTAFLVASFDDDGALVCVSLYSEPEPTSHHVTATLQQSDGKSFADACLQTMVIWLSVPRRRKVWRRWCERGVRTSETTREHVRDALLVLGLPPSADRARLRIDTG